MKTFWNFLKKVFGAVRKVYIRSGLDKFLKAHTEEALKIVAELATVNNNVEFHQWKDQAFVALKKATGSVRDNWIAILVHLAYESYKGSKTSEGIILAD